MTANMLNVQAASELENLKMIDSPIKKINFEPAGKENIPFNTPVANTHEIKKPIVEKPIVEPVKVEEKSIEKPKVAPTIKSEEASEPLLQENPHRFVLFPIKYHEVGDSHASRVKCFCIHLT